MTNQILALHDEAAANALRARASLIEAMLSANMGFAANMAEWIELYRHDVDMANRLSDYAAKCEALHGSVFPGVCP